MALVLKDRVKEQTTTTGTGTVTLGGAISGFDTFASVGNGNTTYYAIVSQTADEWEVGLGTYTASGTTLSRDTVLESSNSDAAVNFSAGTKDVFVTYPADKSVYYDAAGTVNIDSLRLVAGVTVTSILDEDNMASNSATALSTQQSIKAYVDAQVDTTDTLAEVLAIGNTTGGTDLGVSAGDDVTFTDSSKAIFGAGSDLKIFHEGSNSYIQDLGTGGLLVEGSSVTIRNSGGTEAMASFTPDGAVSLYHNNAIKLATAATGVTMTGEVTATGFTGTLDGVLGGGTPAAITGTALTLTTGATVTTVLDEDNMASNSATALATQQSIKAYVDANGDGDVVGPASATDNAVVRFDATTGKLIQNSGVLITDGNEVTATGFTGTLDGVLGGGTPAAATVTTLSATTSLGNTTSAPVIGTEKLMVNATGSDAAAGLRTATGSVLGLWNAGDNSTTRNLIQSFGRSGASLVWNVGFDTSDNVEYLVAGGGNHSFSGGNLLMANAAGPSILNEAATSTNPTLIPNRASPTDGIGAATAGNVHIITGGVNRVAIGSVVNLGMAGSYATAALSFNGDFDTGLYHVAADSLGIATGGGGRLTISNTSIVSGVAISMTTATGPAMLNEVASSTNPTLVPNNSDPDTGMGWVSANIGSLVAGGVKALQWQSSGVVSVPAALSFTDNNGPSWGSTWQTGNAASQFISFYINSALNGQVDATGVTVGNAAGPSLLNEAASSTNPTLIPNKAAPTNGIGAANTNTVSLIAGGAEVFRINSSSAFLQGTALEGDNAAGPKFLNEAASPTNPTFAPNKTDPDTGIGWAAANHMSLIAGGVEVARLASSGTIDLKVASPKIQAVSGVIKLSIAGTIGAQVHAEGMSLLDGVTAPSAVTGRAIIYVDTADGDLKVKFADGQVAVITAAGSGGGKILQVIEATTTTQVDTTSTSYVDTALTGSITPSATGSKILVLISLAVNSAGGDAVAECKIVRTIGATATDKYVYSQISAPENQKGNHFLSVLDSPSSTSACVYKVQAFLTDQSGTLQFQRNDGADIARSTITLMEVGA